METRPQNLKDSFIIGEQPSKLVQYITYYKALQSLWRTFSKHLPGEFCRNESHQVLLIWTFKF